MPVQCPLCLESKTKVRTDNSEFINCATCNSVFRHPKFHLSLEDEKQRYLKHDNNINDSGYQEFVTPLLTAVLDQCNANDIGLDYGAGTGPVLAKLLNQKHYKVYLWDPFFHPDDTVLEASYDYIICCEVIEHFRDPREEFQKLKKLIKPGGLLLCMTHLLTEEINFANWYYQRDPTHVFLYTESSMTWIKRNFEFSSLSINGRVIALRY